MSQEQNVDPNAINEGILDHLMNPRNYGKIEAPSAVGIGYSDATGEYVLMYLDLDDEQINGVKFMAQGCTDTVVSGSIFTEMIDKSDIAFGNKSAQTLMKNLEGAPEEKKACAEIVIKAYEAAIVNHENRKNGSDEELHKMEIGSQCDPEKNSDL
jgi:nitrogen fixation NifU-like protein